MNNDIIPELLEEIKKAFLSKSRESRILQDKLLALKNKKANYKDANEFAEELGEILADTFKENIKTENLPDGKMFYNIAQRIIDPNMHMTYDMVGDYSRDVQALLNQEAGISIAALKADINQDRIDKIVEKVSSYDSYDDGKWLLDEPMINFAQSIVDSTIKKNVDFHYNLGFKPKIVRREVGGCCKWCKDKAGVYDYEEVKDTGNDVFRRHRYCRCTVDYVPDKSRRQDVWSKQWNDSEKRDKIEERKAIAARSSSIEITKRVRNGELNIKLNREHFEKHHEGNSRFENYYKSRIQKGYGLQSILTIDYDEAQRLIKDNYGKGIVTVTKAGKARNEEEFNFHKVIGYYVYDGRKYPTTKGRIIYSKKGSHIIPIKGEYFD